MFHEEKNFTFRFNLEAAFPDEYEGDEDNKGWLQEWERQIKPELLKLIFDSLRTHRTWKVHVRNRGVSPEDEIEISMVKEISSQP
jgi:hypothetical protein